MKSGELAARAEVGVQTLHYYERIGLLPKPDRSISNYRHYPAAALRRVQFIKKAQALGFTLEEIKEILDLHDRRRAPCGHVADLGRKHLRELDARIAALRAFRRDLAVVLPKWEKKMTSQRQCAGEFCDLIEDLPANADAIPRSQKKIKKPLPL
jgi:DNA-binding transcriptional MerR regulator